MSDELIYLDISQTQSYDLGRVDLNHASFSSNSEIIQMVASRCFMPLTFGGGIRSIDDIRFRIRSGSDKITLNSAVIDNPGLITQCAHEFGSQCCVVSIDAKRLERGYVCYKGGRIPTNHSPVELVKIAENAGAGEVIINSIDKDGSGQGFDLELINLICDAVKMPVIALGGAGNWSHFEEVLTQTKASAVAAANIFHYSENSVYTAQKHLYERGLNVRKPLPLSVENKNL
jgi:cyclase